MIAEPLTRPRDVQVACLGANTAVLRSRTWDRLKFEVEYALGKGTTANAYLIRADRSALIDPPGESFTHIFLAELQQQIALEKLDYLILSHVNPNRMATLAPLLEKAPHLTLICSKPAANALKSTFPQWEEKLRVVRSEDTLDLGQGHVLQFAFAPTPRWADGLLTFDSKTRILYTDKLFGVHLCEDVFIDEDWKQLDRDRRYYFDCLHAAQARQVEAILDRIETFPAKYYAPAHGVAIRYSLSRLFCDYRQWCQQQKSQDLSVALFYASAYGNTATLASAIAQGLVEQGVSVEALDCELAEPDAIANAVKNCDGFIIGSPTLGGHLPVQMQTALGIVLANASKTKLAGVFGSYGWSGEAIDAIESKLKDSDYRFGFDTLRVRFTPDEMAVESCQSAGRNFARALKKRQKNRMAIPGVTEAQADRTEQAVGRIIGSLCVLTTRHCGLDYGLLTAWVSQASFNPPGLMISIPKKPALEIYLDCGHAFVLNILKEGRNLRRHFSAQLENQTCAGLATQTAGNHCLILKDALAYLECTVQQRIETGDCWLIYALVQQGDLLSPDGITAIQQRKSGRQY